MRKLARIVGIGAASALLVVVVWSVVAGPVTVLRIVRYGDTDIFDYRHDPARRIHASDEAPEPTHASSTAAIPNAALEALNPPKSTSPAAALAALDTIALVVLHDGEIAFESYAHGHGPKHISQLFSVTKSITALVVGIAIEDGYLDGVDQPITDLVPELAAAGFDRVTLDHLLTMTSGTSYHENDNPFGKHVIYNYTPRLEERIVAQRMEAEPGTRWRYKSGDSALIGLALARALDPASISGYTERRLWQPLGAAHDALWTLDRADDGLERTWCCLATTARDLARVGQLVLAGGVAHGTRVLPEAWISTATATNHVPERLWPKEFTEAGWRGYGYFWWLGDELRGDRFALGKDGQYLYVDPSTQVVIVRLGRSRGSRSSSSWIEFFRAVADAVATPHP